MIVALDIGTTKIRAIIGERNTAGFLEITGVGISPSQGMRRGAVVNIESTLRSVVRAIEAAELMSGRKVEQCWTSIGGSSVEGLISRGVVAVSGKHHEQREISEADVSRVLEAARAVQFPMDRAILEVIPLSFSVDSQSGIRNPLDMIGVRLESEVHILTCSQTIAQNIMHSVNRAGFTVEGFVLQTIAAGSAVLTEEEKDAGVAVVDLGGGTTNVLVYLRGAPYATFSIPMGGNQVSSDISIVKSISPEIAERIKIEAGCCWAPLVDGMNDEIIVPGMGGRAPFSIPRSMIFDIVEPRMREIFSLVRQRLDALPALPSLGGGLVLTGGGAKLLGAADLAAHIFNMPVRLGEPIALGGLADDYRSPEYATAIGLVIEGDMRRQEHPVSAVREIKKREGTGRGPLTRIVHWVKSEFF